MCKFGLCALKPGRAVTCAEGVSREADLLYRSSLQSASAATAVAGILQTLTARRLELRKARGL